MYNHILNDLVHFWLKNPEASQQDTIMYAVAERLIEVPNSEFIEYIKEQREVLSQRTIRKCDWLDELPKDDIPLGSNPFMDGCYD